MIALLQIRTNVQTTASEGAVMTGEIDTAPMSDWDIVDEASLDSFPASDPPSWWAGGSGK